MIFSKEREVVVLNMPLSYTLRSLPANSKNSFGIFWPVCQKCSQISVLFQASYPIQIKISSLQIKCCLYRINYDSKMMLESQYSQ